MAFSRDSSETARRLLSVSQGDAAALELLMNQHRDYLRRVVDARMDDGLRQRIDPSDVIQETLAVASQRIEDYIRRRPASFRLWLRTTALERLVDARRHHFTQKRSVAREVPMTDASSLAIARSLVTGRPSERLQRQESMQQVRTALAGMPKADHEILIMRHSEGLTNMEVAELLQITPSAASKRYGRALQRLADRLADLGFLRT